MNFCRLSLRVTFFLGFLGFHHPALSQNLTFPDGFQVGVVRSDFTEGLEYVRTMTVAPKPVGQISSHFYTWDAAPYTVGMHFNGGPNDSTFQKATWATKAKVPALFLLVKAHYSDGSVFVPDGCYLNGELSRIERQNGSIKKLTSSKEDKWEPEGQPLHFQVTDGDTGWRDMDGPVVFDAADGHGVVSTHVFPRTVKELEFRILRQGQAPQHFRIRNPSYQPNPAPLVPSIHPYEIKMEDGVFRLRIGAPHFNKPKLFFRPWVDFEMAVKPAATQRYNLIDRMTSVFDATGNYYPEGRFGDRVWPIPGQHLFRVVLRVERQQAFYPWKRSQVRMIAEGRAGTTASDLPKATINADGKKMGFHTILFKPAPKGKKGHYTKLPWNFSFEIKGSGRDAKEFEKTYVCLFPQKGGVQKEIHGPLCGGASVSLPLGLLTTKHFDVRYDWAGDLAPDEKFDVGVVVEPTQEAEFVIDLNAVQR